MSASDSSISTESLLSSPPSPSSLTSSSSPHPPGHRLLLGVLHPPGALLSFTILFLINLLNMIDRYIPSAVKLQIQSSYSLNNFETSLPLTIFILVYMCACPLFGLLADRGWSRRGLICVGVISWCLLTAATAIAPNYPLYVLIRGLIGVGEASYSTIAPAILADFYPPQERSKILGLFYAGTPVGAALGYGLGGAIGEAVGWKAAFAIIGLPGILLGLLMLKTVDPVRGGMDVKMAGGVEESVMYQHETQWQAVKLLLFNPMFAIATVGQVFSTWGVGGIGDWFPAYLETVYTMNETTTGLVSGAATVVGGLGGTLLGVWLGERLKSEVRHAYLVVPGLGCIGAALGSSIILAFNPPFALVVFLLVSAQLSLWCGLGPINALIANVVHSRHRTRAFALTTFAQHAFGDAASPSIIGAVADVSTLPLACTLIPMSWMVAGGVWLVASRWMDEERTSGVIGGEDEVVHAVWEEVEEQRWGGKEIGGREGDGSAVISEQEREAEALDAVRDVTHNQYN